MHEWIPIYRKALGRRVTAGLIVILCAFLPASAGSVKKAHLEEMVDRSGVIIVGTCISAQPSLVHIQGHPIPVTHYRFKITESIKGSAAGEYTLIQLGWPGQLQLSEKGAAATRLPPSIDGPPEYRPSQEYLLMLTQPSSLGLSSPVGWSQSTFIAERSADGGKTWRNGLGNHGLFDGPSARFRQYPESLPASADTTGSEVLPYREFIDTVRAIAHRGR